MYHRIFLLKKEKNQVLIYVGETTIRSISLWNKKMPHKFWTQCLPTTTTVLGPALEVILTIKNIYLTHLHAIFNG